ncbi:hypothetical protein NDU88_005561 [Pleurodeles waltl]|uniref:Uncharacterized protein n=1 Tax=Pleurodeles waltl TaxID=8319 RepID=A0AAV7TWX9_PLEWA|nr:hypothetical protein NDU88_005561 [Pleurodeles waltl]
MNIAQSKMAEIMQPINNACPTQNGCSMQTINYVCIVMRGISLLSANVAEKFEKMKTDRQDAVTKAGLGILKRMKNAAGMLRVP